MDESIPLINNEEVVEEPKTLPNISMSVEKIEEEPPKKIKKKRRPMTAEHKAKLVASLAKAREASALKRGKVAKAKKILKAQDDEQVDKILDAHIKNKKEKETLKDKEIAKLKSQLENLTLQDVVPKKPKVMETIKEEVVPKPVPVAALPTPPKPPTLVKSPPIDIPKRRNGIIRPRKKPRM